MSVKSVIEIDVKDDKFKAFQAVWDKYQAELEKQGPAWAEANKEIDGATNKFVEMAAALELAGQLEKAREQEAEKAAKKRAEDEKRLNDLEANRGRLLKDTLKTTKQIAGSVAETTMSLLKWVGVGTLLSGVVGLGGGLFGLEALALSAGNSRRTAQGIGVSTGQLQASRLTLGRYIDAEGNLGAIADAQNDLTQRYRFSAMGVNPAGKDPGQLQAEMFERARNMYKNSDRTQQSAEAHGLLQFYTMADLRRMASLSDEEAHAAERQLKEQTKALDVADRTNRAWQDFTVRLGIYGQRIENTFVRGLVKLTPGLEKIGDALVTTLGKLVDNGTFAHWVDEFAAGIEKVGDYLGKPQFQKDVDTFVKDIGILAQKTVDALMLLGLIPDSHVGANLAPPGSAPTNLNPFSPANTQRGDRSFRTEWGAVGNWLGGLGYGHNTMNLRSPEGSFRVFASDEDSIRAGARQLQRYQDMAKWGHADTLDKIIPIYAPKSDHNNPAQYIRNMQTWTGLRHDQHLNTHDPDTLARMIMGILRQEGHRQMSKEMVLKVINATGGSATTSAATASR